MLKLDTLGLYVQYYKFPKNFKPSADVYGVYYFNFNSEIYAIILKEYCKVDEP